MFAIIYSGQSLPSCNLEVAADAKSMKHACQPALLTQIADAMGSGVSVREFEKDSFRHVLDLGNYRNRQALVDALEITVVIHEEGPVRVYSGEDIGLTEQGNISCPYLCYFSFPWGKQWEEALTTGWKTRNFTMYARLK